MSRPYPDDYYSFRDVPCPKCGAPKGIPCRAHRYRDQLYIPWWGWFTPHNHRKRVKLWRQLFLDKPRKLTDAETEQVVGKLEKISDELKDVAKDRKGICSRCSRAERVYVTSGSMCDRTGWAYLCDDCNDELDKIDEYEY